jgi:hypothetical protein
VGALIAALQLLRVLRQLDPDPRYPLVLEDGDDFAEDPFMREPSCSCAPAQLSDEEDDDGDW